MPNLPIEIAGVRVFYNGATKQLCLVAEEDAPVGMGGIFKVNKNGLKCALFLVEVNDANASNIRVQTSSGVKAIRLFTEVLDAWEWGVNQSGQLGDNSIDTRASPVSIVGAHSFVQISPGYKHTLALKSDGTCWAWGLAGSQTAGVGGQLGDNQITANRSSPVSVVGNHSFLRASAHHGYRGAHSLGLKTTGDVWAWGVNNYGDVGDNTISHRSSPVSVVGAHSFDRISCGYYLSSGLKFNNGTVWCWGRNNIGQLAQNNLTHRSSPVSILGAHSFIDIGSCKGNIIALKTAGDVWTWGLNTYGELGDNSVANRSSPVSVVGAHSFIQATCGDIAVCGGLKVDGSAWCWGRGTFGSCGDNAAANRSSPVSVVGGHSFVELHSSITSFGLKSDGSLWGWGYNGKGQLGDTTLIDRSSPVLVAGAFSFSSITRNGGYRTMGGIAAFRGSKAFLKDLVWGRNDSGQLGDRFITNKSAPTLMTGNHVFSSVAGSQFHTLGSKATGDCWAWGLGANGVLGDNTVTNRSSPVSVVGAHSFVGVATNRLATTGGVGAGWKSAGDTWTWGPANYGALGDNQTAANRSSPVSVIGAHLLTQVSSGVGFFIGIKSDGSAWAWGRNTQGQLGDNTIANKSSPVSLVGAHSFTRIASGINTSFGLKADNTCWAWGYNSKGYVGDNTVTNRSSPVSVVGAHLFTKVSSLEAHALALKSDGSVWAWGPAANGVLGDNQVAANRSSPVSVVGTHSFIDIAAGFMSSFGLKANGSVWAWGLNTYGALGDSSITNRSSPVSVVTVGALSFNAIFQRGQGGGGSAII